MTSAWRIGSAMVALLAVNCNWEQCDLEWWNSSFRHLGTLSRSGSKPAPIGGMEVFASPWKYKAHGKPTAPLGLVVDGIQLRPEVGMRWVADGAFSDLASDADCARAR